MRNILFYTLLTALLTALLFLTACDSSPQKYMGTNEEQSQKWESTITGIANPASTHCFDQGHSTVIKQDSKGGQYGICVFDDGSWCDEWDYFRGYCEQGTNMTSCKKIQGKTICPGDFIPVCGYNNQTSKWENFNNDCYACTSENIVGFRFDKCK